MSWPFHDVEDMTSARLGSGNPTSCHPHNDAIYLLDCAYNFKFYLLSLSSPHSCCMPVCKEQLVIKADVTELHAMCEQDVL